MLINVLFRTTNHLSNKFNVVLMYRQNIEGEMTVRRRCKFNPMYNANENVYELVIVFHLK